MDSTIFIYYFLFIFTIHPRIHGMLSGSFAFYVYFLLDPETFDTNIKRLLTLEGDKFDKLINSIWSKKMNIKGVRLPD